MSLNALNEIGSIQAMTHTAPIACGHRRSSDGRWRRSSENRATHSFAAINATNGNANIATRSGRS